MLYQTPILSIKITQTPISKIHIVVSKRIFKSAVERNTLKRRIRHILLESFTEKPKNKTIFIYTKEEIKNKNYQEIKKEIQGLLKKSKLL